MKKLINSSIYIIVIFSTTILYSQSERFELITESSEDKTYLDNNTIKHNEQNTIHTFWFMIVPKTIKYHEIFDKYIDYQLWKFELDCIKETIVLKRVIVFYTDNTSTDGGEVINLSDDSIIPLTVGETLQYRFCK